MYGKIFDSMYDGTLVEDWRALITFQQFIVLCDADGIVDMTPHAISRRTGIPIEHIKAGIEILNNPDPYSRTDKDEGRRIANIDGHRPWGWYIVNHEKYRDLRTVEDRREYMQEYMKEYRRKQKSLQEVNSKQPLAQLANTDTDTDTDTKDKPPKVGPIGMKKYLEECKASKISAIPEDDPVFKYAEETGIPRPFLTICWLEFVERNIASGKRYTSWKKAFQNCVRGGWYKLWWVKDGEYVLSTNGVQANLKHKVEL